MRISTQNNYECSPESYLLTPETAHLRFCFLHRALKSLACGMDDVFTLLLPRGKEGSHGYITFGKLVWLELYSKAFLLELVLAWPSK